MDVVVDIAVAAVDKEYFALEELNRSLVSLVSSMLMVEMFVAFEWDFVLDNSVVDEHLRINSIISC